MVSRMTLYRRRVEFGMLDEPSSIIGEEELISVFVKYQENIHKLDKVLYWDDYDLLDTE